MEIVNQIIEAYIKVMGKEKWNSLTAEEQHTVIMTIATDLYNRIEEGGQSNEDLYRRIRNAHPPDRERDVC